MSAPRSAVSGNLLGGTCVLGAITLTLISNGILDHRLLLFSMAAGAAIGLFLATKVAMIQIPQLVALFNGLGGGASALVGLLACRGSYGDITVMSKSTGSLALAVGGLTLSGSLIAAAKLAQRIAQRPIVLRGHTALSTSTLALVAAFVALTAVASHAGATVMPYLTLLVALLFGLLLAIRVGGADMPITISLLNSLSGVAAAATGFAVSNPLLVAVGAIVGAGGLVLTRLMCRAMNRTLLGVLTGRMVVPRSRQVAAPGTAATGRAKPEMAETPSDGEEVIASVLGEARTVVIVPGYGMALAQAQYQVKQLLEELEGQGKEVKFAIHPVAGRMPGHMNVLLAEVGVPYQKLHDMDDINPEFEATDLAIVVGANDVVNPAASTAEGTPIYGMPILRVSEAKHVMVCNLDAEPGYSGVENPLYQFDNVIVLLGDAKETVRGLVDRLDKIHRS
jgi:NAD(P) transhydrogenase subunit beta